METLTFSNRPLLDVGERAVSSKQVHWAQFFVWAVWIFCTVAALFTVWRRGPLPPWSDDWNMVPAIVGAQPVTLDWLWAQHNEHRIVVPKLVFVFAARLSGGDFRWPIYANIVALSSAAAGLLFAARRLRGSLGFSDAFIPLFMLHFGQGGMLWGFEFQFVSATVLACGLLAILLGQGASLNWRAAGPAGVCLLLLPLCGGNGLLYVPIVALWVGLRGYWQWRGRGPIAPRTADFLAPRPVGDRSAGLWLLAAAASSCCVATVYFIGYVPTAHPWPKAGPALTLLTTDRILTGGFGEKVERFWPVSGIAMGALLVGSFGYAASLAISQKKEWSLRFRAFDLAIFLAAALLLAAGVGYGRGGQGWDPGMDIHYCSLALPAIVIAYLVLCLPSAPFLRGGIQAALFALSALFAGSYFYTAARSAPYVPVYYSEVKHDLLSGLPGETIASRHVGKLFYLDTPEARALIASGIQQLRAAGFTRYGPP